MIRPQRNTHAWVWPLVGAGLAAGVAIGLSSRRPEPVQHDPAPGLDPDASPRAQTSPATDTPPSVPFAPAPERPR